jgi:CDP-glycerol glycerophosphotransferase
VYRTLAKRRRAAAPSRSEPAREYRARLRAPIDPDLAVFAAYWYRGYYCNPRAIYERARELAPKLRGVWVVKGGLEGAIPAGVDYVVAGTTEYYDLIARARYFVNNVNFPNHLVKRDGTLHVMTHHGTPLKRMGLDLRGTAGADTRTDFDGLMRRAARWDYSISQNAFSTNIWQRAFPVPFESLEVGYPRNDMLATATEDDARRIRAELEIPADRHVILYAPTRREYDPTYLPVSDVVAAAEQLSSDSVVLARLHYLDSADRRLAEMQEAGLLRDVTDHPSVEELCIAADLLITDYSSIMFDFAVLDRPIVIHAPDWEEYRVRRGTYFDVTAEPPGIVTATRPALVEALSSEGFASEQANMARGAFRARFCMLDDGHAAERVVRRLWAGETQGAHRSGAAAI